MPSPAQQINEAFGKFDPSSISDAERSAFAHIRATVPGWSDWRHWCFFRALKALWDDSRQRSLLILGVYHGQDIAIMRAVGLGAHIVGVDKFSDTECADWPEAWRGRSWQAIGIGPAPSIAAAQACLQSVNARAVLVCSDDAEFLAQCPIKFDLIYLDTAHDETTVARQIRQVQECHLLSDNGILAGDDWDNLEPGWGVRDALAAAKLPHHVISHRIWWCDAAALKPPVMAAEEARSG